MIRLISLLINFICVATYPAQQSPPFQPEYWLTIQPKEPATPHAQPLFDARSTTFTAIDARLGLPGTQITQNEFSKLGIGINEYIRRVGRQADHLFTQGVAWQYVESTESQPAHCIATHQALDISPLLFSPLMYTKCNEKLGNNLLFFLIETGEIRVYSHQFLAKLTEIAPILAEQFSSSTQKVSAELWLKSEIHTNPTPIGSLF